MTRQLEDKHIYPQFNSSYQTHSFCHLSINTLFRYYSSEALANFLYEKIKLATRKVLITKSTFESGFKTVSVGLDVGILGFPAILFAVFPIDSSTDLVLAQRTGKYYDRNRRSVKFSGRFLIQISKCDFQRLRMK